MEADFFDLANQAFKNYNIAPELQEKFKEIFLAACEEQYNSIGNLDEFRDEVDIGLMIEVILLAITQPQWGKVK